jgi:hypothetical protein
MARVPADDEVIRTASQGNHRNGRVLGNTEDTPVSAFFAGPELAKRGKDFQMPSNYFL